ncbi:MAG: TrmH family RNA methyltransferase [Myxococcota bacterium]
MRSVRIHSPADPRVDAFRDVKDADLRGRDDAFMVEGRLLVRRLVSDSRFAPRQLLLTATALDALREALEDLPDQVPVYLADPDTLNEVVGFDLHRGCLALADRGRAIGAGELLAAGRVPRPRLALVAEQLTNPDNIGGLFRNAMAFGVAGVLLCPRCTDPLYRKAVRVSMGGALQVPFARSEDWPGDLESLRARGWRVAALDPRGDSMEIGELAATTSDDEPVALVVGTEGAGLSPGALAAADWRVRIEMAPGVDSLNVATAAAIALHGLARQRGRAARRVAS